MTGVCPVLCVVEQVQGEELEQETKEDTKERRKRKSRPGTGFRRRAAQKRKQQARAGAGAEVVAGVGGVMKAMETKDGAIERSLDRDPRGQSNGESGRKEDDESDAPKCVGSDEAARDSSASPLSSSPSVSSSPSPDNTDIHSDCDCDGDSSGTVSTESPRTATPTPTPSATAASSSGDTEQVQVVVREVLEEACQQVVEQLRRQEQEQEQELVAQAVQAIVESLVQQVMELEVGTAKNDDQSVNGAERTVSDSHVGSARGRVRQRENKRLGKAKAKEEAAAAAAAAATKTAAAAASKKKDNMSPHVSSSGDSVVATQPQPVVEPKKKQKFWCRHCRKAFRNNTIRNFCDACTSCTRCCAEHHCCTPLPGDRQLEQRQERQQPQPQQHQRQQQQQQQQASFYETQQVVNRNQRHQQPLRGLYSQLATTARRQVSLFV